MMLPPFPRLPFSLNGNTRTAVTDMLAEMIDDETAAVSRYKDYAKRAEERGDNLTAALFNLLSYEEAKHRDVLADRLKKIRKQ